MFKLKVQTSALHFFHFASNLSKASVVGIRWLVCGILEEFENFEQLSINQSIYKYLHEIMHPHEGVYVQVDQRLNMTSEQWSN